jgi:hypothetical protein
VREPGGAVTGRGLVELPESMSHASAALRDPTARSTAPPLGSRLTAKSLHETMEILSAP